MKSLNRLLAVTAVCVSAIAGAQTMNPQVADPSFDAWVQTHPGRITKQQYMDEAGRRWDAMDTSGQGLTAAQVRSMYRGAPTPNMVKRGNNQTNPTGTELKGQNSGGK